MTEYNFDVVVIGAGPAGYVAAIRCAQLGLRTACVDNWLDDEDNASPGGTCLNAGCIPSKALLDISAEYQRLGSLAERGLKIGKTQLNMAAMHGHKNQVVKRLTGGIKGLLKTNKVHFQSGRGCLLPGLKVAVSTADEEQQWQAEHVILAAGSRPITLDEAVVDNTRIFDSAGALQWQKVPRRVAVIGAGVIGLELGSIWRRLGSEVALLEAQDVFLSMADRSVVDAAARCFADQGLDIRLSARLLASKASKNGLLLTYQDGRGDHEMTVDRAIVAVGRRPNTEGLAAPESELLLDERGFIHVGEDCRTNLPQVYAIGDLVRGPMLAHKGSEEGVMVAERIAGQASNLNYQAIPSVIYTDPEIAWVGQTEEQLQAADHAYHTGIFPFAANGRSQATDTSEGLVKLIGDADNDQLLGAHIVGSHASELIGQLVLAMEFEASVEDIARTVFAHPTLSEAVHEAALAVDNRSVHKANRVAAKRVSS